MSLVLGIEPIRRNNDRVGGVPFVIFKPAVKTALSSGVASHTPHLSDNVEHAVAVTIKPNFVQLLHVSRLFALTPKLAARA